MTPSQRLRAQAAELIRLADELDGAPESAPPPALRPEPDRWIDTATAMRLARCSHSTVTRWCRRFGIGHQLPSGQWRVSRRALLAFLEARARGEFDERGEGERLPMANGSAHPRGEEVR
ncbi:helix-turn-helix domain-containing protein [Methylocystis echinoides]|uniref:Helix-turn-helix domain-containing protein n=1 Tax=Methylocystis echinoides TaxID=29468 RepID=A0A9W6LSU4_9HYPH|nr:helix-turn-helix domain-containing protein [Methylocystis echinoides]GLI93669.1 hypothetical protein LMG27198_26610 [Methylocystis echinoides]